MCLLTLFYSNHFHQERLLVVEAVNCFGEWGGRTVSPHPHAHSTHDFVVRPLMQTLLPLHELLNTQALQFRVLLVVVHLHALPICLLMVFTHENFPGFTPMVFFCRFVNSVAVSFTHGLIRGFCIVVVHALVVRL